MFTQIPSEESEPLCFVIDTVDRRSIPESTDWKWPSSTLAPNGLFASIEFSLGHEFLRLGQSWYDRSRKCCLSELP